MTKMMICVGVAWLVSLVAMVTCDILRRRILAKAPADTLEVSRPSLKNPWNEVLLGILLTMAIFFFAVVSLAGQASIMVSAGIACASTFFSSFSGFTRSKKALFELGLAKGEKCVCGLLIGFYVGMAILLNAILGTVLIAYQMR